MQKSNAPTKLTVAFASGSGAGPVNAVPLTPGGTAGTASYQTGFTSVNMEPIASGGIPPFGADFNGLHNAATTAQIWQQSGYMYSFDSGFAGNANIGGYPAGSVLQMGSGKGLWINQTDNNTASPDATGSAGWLGIPAAGIYTIATTGGTNTPDPSVLGVTTLLVTGALTSNATIVLPLSAGSRWIIANNTTGSYTLTVQGATGAGVAITQGSALTVFTDGTAYFAASANISGAYLPIGGTAVAATKLATARDIAMSGDVTWTVSFDGSANATEVGTIAAGAVTLAKMANLTGNTLLGNPTGSSATPQAVTLANGLAFSGATLGMGDITPNTVTSAGAITATTGAITCVTNFTASTSTANLNTTGAGTISLRPNGQGVATGQVTIAASGAVTTNGMLTVNGTITSTGTVNFNTSDRHLKKNIKLIRARPIHRHVRFVSYDRKDIIASGRGSIAQEVQKFDPSFVNEYDHAAGKRTVKRLAVDQLGMAYEQAIWAGEELDRQAKVIASQAALIKKLVKRIEKLEQK